MALTSRRLQPGAYTLPFPYWHQLGVDPSTPPAELSQMCLNQLNLLLAQASAPKDTAAIIIEPVLGEGGYVPAPSEFLHGLREICDKHGIMLIIDEVQCGFGRTGKNYYTEYSDVRPDILLSAKVRVVFRVLRRRAMYAYVIGVLILTCHDASCRVWRTASR